MSTSYGCIEIGQADLDGMVFSFRMSIATRPTVGFDNIYLIIRSCFFQGGADMSSAFAIVNMLI